jgi:hypothetical protein
MLSPYEKLLTEPMDPDLVQATRIPDPVGIGAVGGSGTRLVTQIVTRAGLLPATSLNEADDAIEWPPFERLLEPGAQPRQERQVLMNNIFAAFETLLCERRDKLGRDGRSNWKVPGTFFWLRELSAFFPRMQYIHLIRNGLDMAYSGNQNQIGNWAEHLGVEIEYQCDDKVRPRSMLEYWLTANEHALTTGAEYLRERFLLVRFEDLCDSPLGQVQRIMRFLGLQPSSEKLVELVNLVKTPDSLGRYQDFDWQHEFTALQLKRLQALGYIG